MIVTLLMLLGVLFGFVTRVVVNILYPGLGMVLALVVIVGTLIAPEVALITDGLYAGLTKTWNGSFTDVGVLVVTGLVV